MWVVEAVGCRVWVVEAVGYRVWTDSLTLQNSGEDKEGLKLRDE